MVLRYLPLHRVIFLSIEIDITKCSHLKENENRCLLMRHNKDLNYTEHKLFKCLQLNLQNKQTTKAIYSCAKTEPPYVMLKIMPK